MREIRRMKRPGPFAAPAMGFALASMISTEADARGIMIINTGEDVMKIADIDADMRRDGERFEKAVAHLVEQGVPEEQGRPNLWYLCGLEQSE